MPHSYEDKFERALCHLKDPGHLSPSGYSPIVAVVYTPGDAMTMRAQLVNVLIPKAQYHGFKVHTLSLGEVITQYVENHRLRKLWSGAAIRETDLHASISQEITRNHVIENAILDFQESCRNDPHALIVLTDLEMLQPFTLIGKVESEIYTKVSVPILILYPGEAQGMARSFLGIYTQDGNYRAKNF